MDVHILPFERNVMFFRTFPEVTEYDYILSAVFLLYLNTKITREKNIYKIIFWACTALLTPSICGLACWIKITADDIFK